MTQQQQKNIDEKLNKAEDYFLSLDNYSEDERKYIKHKLSHVKFQIKKRLSVSHYIEERFFRKNKDWLDGIIEIPHSKSRPGRPKKSFDYSSERSKRRKTENIRKETQSEELVFASQMKLRAEGKTDASNVVKNILKSPTRASKYRKAFSRSKTETNNIEQISPLDALCMFVEAGLTRRQYEVIRSCKKELYPCYSIIQNEKKKCYPKPDSFHVTALCAEVNLQDLLDHTATRLLTYLREVLTSLHKQTETFTLTYKWGCDGSQQVQYNQKFENEADSDSYIFQSSCVPLQLTCGEDNKKVIWQNPIPSSPRYCRPIKIRFVRESTDITNDEINYVQNKISSLKETKILQDNNSYCVKHALTLTMIDGKVCNAVTSTKSTMKCYICGATSKDFNNLSLKKTVHQENLTFGLSILHARIRLFEGLLHLSYKLPLKKWQLRSEKEKAIAKERKLKIQEEFKKRIGLIVDVPKAGFGSSNDGNTSRRFFMDPDLAAEITGIDSCLVYRLKVILEVISSGYKINLGKFDSYCLDTAKLYVKLYSWHPMTPTLHKILLHAPIVIEKALLPIGMLSEEAAEARNKHIKSYRLNYARKFSRESCNMDIICRLLLSSDPLITGMRPTHKKKTAPFLKEAIDMFLPAENEYIIQEISDEENPESDDVSSDDEFLMLSD